MRSSISSPGSPEPPALEVRGLTGPADRPIIVDIDLLVRRGETQVVLGPIQCGKSMLMRHLLGLERAERGVVFVDGEEYDPTDGNDGLLRRLRTRIGAMFEGSALLTKLTAIENVELPLLEHTDVTAAEARETARELLAEVGMEIAGEVTPAELGRAARRRVALARALALRPAVLLLDEPTLGLDPHTAAEFDETLAALQPRHGFGVLIFSHEVRYAFGAVEHIYVMAEGTIVEHGDRDAIQHSGHPVVRQLVDRRGHQ
ncbi:MAG TPA: ATP-binding cassette domain-containing protein [Gemmatimonadaceae bacterium]|nr:ATP-binding cassette domain-containing protein [Gemmatimonadaceae bacterium]